MPVCSVLLLFISSFGTSATNLIIVKKKLTSLKHLVRMTVVG